MLNPSRTVVLWLGVLAVVLLALGLATDLGLFGWTIAALFALYLIVVGVSRLARRHADTA